MSDLSMEQWVCVPDQSPKHPAAPKHALPEVVATAV